EYQSLTEIKLVARIIEASTGEELFNLKGPLRIGESSAIAAMFARAATGTSQSELRKITPKPPPTPVVSTLQRETIRVLAEEIQRKMAGKTCSVGGSSRIATPGSDLGPGLHSFLTRALKDLGVTVLERDALYVIKGDYAYLAEPQDDPIRE